MSTLAFAVILLAASTLILAWTTFLFWRIANRERESRLAWKRDYYELREDYYFAQQYGTTSSDSETGA